jgi:uncharacterized protein YeaO (DUF488 family)
MASFVPGTAMSERDETELYMIRIKRVYLDPSPGDGLRILIDRVWPRGMTKEKAKVDEWRKEWAPSAALRKWFAHDVAKWKTFRERYRSELQKSVDKSGLEDLAGRAKHGPVTLVYSARDERHNQAVVLKEWIEELSS